MKPPVSEQLSEALHFIVVDLMTPGLDLESVTKLIAEIPDSDNVRPILIGYAPHVRGDLFKAAREAGFDHVLPKSRLVMEVRQLLEEGSNA
ncbi:response regulator [Calycomorphotria hydatis]|uniref:Response regulatory domain-containing protein n=1 Tax=Calycomorphotria hydatis TaxID=2528027 RepID=A0A517TA86_9PLAN|nr:hypothetical protein [Calycomorphotria hydatis]QDT65292.1 hypothetical protein V22_25400 [Calycomorphotria hydatis]